MQAAYARSTPAEPSFMVFFALEWAFYLPGEVNGLEA
jgi:hypothetical protein